MIAKLVLCCLLISSGAVVAAGETDDVTTEQQPMLLKTSQLKDYVKRFNASDYEVHKNTYSNEDAYAFLSANIPLFECPDEDIERTYYFRWWVYRKHIRKTEDGFVVTEFLPKVRHSSKHNVISCAAGHHFREGRWLHDPRITKDYMTFFLTDPKSGAHRYSFCPADAILAINAVHPDDAWLTQMLDPLVAHHRAWDKLRTSPKGLYAQIDLFDGTEWTAGGRVVTGSDTFIKKVRSVRPNFNSYMYGDALALSKIAAIAGEEDLSKAYREEAGLLKGLIQDRLWNDALKFFTILPSDYDENSTPADVREIFGFVPWYFNLPDRGKGYEIAWKQLTDPEGFHAPFGPTTCEQRHPYFRIEYKDGCICQWNGPSWPFSTSQTLTALANLLNDYRQDVIGKKEYFETLKTYTNSHVFRQIPPKDDTATDAIVKEDVCFIHENLDPYTGNWLARYRHNRNKITYHGKDYNHSSYCDLIISGLVGLRPQRGREVVVNPLVPDGLWDWFCLDNIPYHGHILTVIWDKDGSKYGHGKGLAIFADGKEIARSSTRSRTVGVLPTL